MSRKETRTSREETIEGAPNLSDVTDSFDALGPETFTYDVEIDAREPILVLGDSGRLHGRVRHHAQKSLEFGPPLERPVNLGIRVYRSEDNAQLFEDRMVIGSQLLAPNVWAPISVRIPREIINFTDSFRLLLDFVKEEEYWFSASPGVVPFEINVRFADAAEKARARAAPTKTNFDGKSERAALPSRNDSMKVAADEHTSEAQPYNIVFDVSDLIQYFHNARLPTGIQRVQIEIITNLIFAKPNDVALQIACFTKHSDTWLDLPSLFFNHICKLALVGGEVEAPDWTRVIEELAMHLEQAKPLIFHPGAYLINLGTSWWLQNYFLHVRAAKARYGIRYVPFVHDCIPIMTPEHCVEGLTRDFITWVMGAFQHADRIICNSNATASDVRKVAGYLGHDIDDPSVVTLDADYRAANASLTARPKRPEESEIFLKNEIRPGLYVLFVSTIESRKNHVMAFSAWLSLVKKYGSARVPKLVCVGNRGWLNDSIYAKLAASKLLRQKVTMLSKIPDPDLELLYKNCMFTLYPSSYEGWGLPVTESLCFGKVPVLANASSLPEAGGEFAEYFDLGSESELLAVLERMIFDVPAREAREHRIRDRFRPRTWSSIANQVVSLVKEWSVTCGPPIKTDIGDRGLWPFTVELGRYYGLVENEETQIWRGMIAGEMFRQGDGWWWPEPWGCWTKARTARMAFIAPLAESVSAVLYIGIRGVQGERCLASVNVEGIGQRQVALGPDQSQWLVFRIPQRQLHRIRRSPNTVLIEVLFSADRSADFRSATAGADHRVASVGVLGFMVCEETDFSARLNFTESVALGDLSGLHVRPLEFSDHFSATGNALDG